MNKDFSSAIILAGGLGLRMGGPKQLLEINGEPCVIKSVNAFKAAEVSEIIVVGTKDVIKEINRRFPDIKTAKAGDTRIESLKNGMAEVAAEATVVAVHDGARPLVNPANIKACVNKALQCGSAVLAAPSKDTIKEVSAGLVTRTLDRSVLYNTQTPQCYRKNILDSALKKFGHLTYATDESQLVEKLGEKVAVIESDYKNIKITTPEDLAAAEAFECMGKKVIRRTGLGFDLHRLEEGRPLYIGGFKAEHNKGFLGHSDGDVVLHAVCDAALGAACMGEIGIMFPPTDPAIKGISSVEIARKVIEMLKEKNITIEYMDVTLVTEEPKIKPLYSAVRESLESIFKIGLENISFKAKSHEGVDAVGAGGAAKCYALVGIIKQEN